MPLAISIRHTYWFLTLKPNTICIDILEAFTASARSTKQLVPKSPGSFEWPKVLLSTLISLNHSHQIHHLLAAIPALDSMSLSLSIILFLPTAIIVPSTGPDDLTAAAGVASARATPVYRKSG